MLRTVVCEEDQDEHEAERYGWGHEGIGGDDLADVIAQDREPRLRGRLAPAPHVLRDTRRSQASGVRHGSAASRSAGSSQPWCESACARRGHDWIPRGAGCFMTTTAGNPPPALPQNGILLCHLTLSYCHYILVL